MRIGYAVEPPFAYPAADGSATGESPQVAKRVLKRAGIEATRWFIIDFDSLIPELLAGRIDMIATGMFITPERQAKIAFSHPVSQVGPGLLTRRGNPRGLRGYQAAAADPEAVLAVLRGAAEIDRLTRLGLPPDRLYPVPDASTGAEAVRQGKADALALSSPSVVLLARQSPAELEAVDADPAGTERSLCAFGFRQIDEALRNTVNAQLDGFLGSPEHLALVAPFGFGPENLPPRSAKTSPERP